MDNPVYHVVLEGRKLGPFDRRTIVGMRIKKTLASKDVLVDAKGGRLTVGELVRGQQQELPAQPEDEGGASPSVLAEAPTARLLKVEGKGYEIPPFQGDVEVTVQGKVLRIAGRFREGKAWKEDRVKFPLADIAQARLGGSVVDLWIRTAGAKEGQQRLSLEMGTPKSAGELTEKLTHTAPWPGSEPLAGRAQGGGRLHPLLWAAVVGSAVLVSVILVWALTR